MAVIAARQERAETEERLRKCCVRIVTENISESPLGWMRAGEEGIRGGKMGRHDAAEFRQVGHG